MKLTPTHGAIAKVIVDHSLESGLALGVNESDSDG